MVLLYSAHMARHDIMVAAFGFGAVYLCLADRSARFPLKSAVAGLAAGLALDIHLNAILYLPVLAALLLADCGWSVPRLLRARRCWGFVGGVCAGAAYLAAMHLRYAQTWLALAKLGPAPARVPPILSLDPGVWWQSLSDMGLFLIVIFTWAAPLLLSALVILSRRRSDSDRRLLVLFAALSLTVAAMVRTKDPFYAILISPAGDLLVAAMLADALQKAAQAWCSGSLRSFVPAGLLPAVMLVALAAALMVNVASVRDDPMADYRAVRDRIAAVVPPDSTVMGPQTYWFALPPDQRYLAWEQLYYYQGYAPGSTLEDGFRALRPDFFILDSRLEQRFPEDKLPGLPIFLERRAHLVATMQTDTFGSVRIYRIDLP